MEQGYKGCNTILDDDRAYRPQPGLQHTTHPLKSANNCWDCYYWRQRRQIHQIFKVGAKKTEDASMSANVEKGRYIHVMCKMHTGKIYGALTVVQLWPMSSSLQNMFYYSVGFYVWEWCIKCVRAQKSFSCRRSSWQCPYTCTEDEEILFVVGYMSRWVCTCKHLQSHYPTLCTCPQMHTHHKAVLHVFFEGAPMFTF